MAEPVRKISPSQRARRLVTGVAWTLLLLSGWFSFRMTVMALIGDTQDFGLGGLGEAVFGKAGGLLLVIHTVWAAVTLCAALGLLKFKPWAHRYFIVFFFVVGAELIALAALWLMTPENDPTAIAALQIASAVIFGLLGAMSAMLGWKFLRDKEIRGLFKKKG